MNRFEAYALGVGTVVAIFMLLLLGFNAGQNAEGASENWRLMCDTAQGNVAFVGFPGSPHARHYNVHRDEHYDDECKRRAAP